MPSQLEHELNKLRGEVSSTGKVYTSSIAALQDALTAAEKAIKSLNTAENNLQTRVNKALSTSRTALSNATASLKRSGDTFNGIFFLPTGSHILGGGIAGGVIGNAGYPIASVTSGTITATSGVNTNVIAESTVGSGVTIDGTTVKDGLVDGLDCSGVETGADVTDNVNVAAAGAVMRDTQDITLADNGTITPNGSHLLRLMTYDNAATDNLDHVFLTNYLVGDRITFVSQDNTKDVTIRDNGTGGGEIYLEGNINFVMMGTYHCITFIVIDVSGTKKLFEQCRFNG